LDSILIGKNVETGEDVSIDLDYLIDQKLQILSNSRGGKSRGARTIAENSNGKIHQIIISPKREFVTLREKFDYVHVGKTSELSKPDIELNTRYAEQLALDIMKTGIDTIIEFSESPKERIKFGKLFAEGLMQVPQQYWHPVMIIWDEIDIWAPEKGHGEAESLGAIVDLAARGADKGYTLVAITQKLSKFNKDVASELNIKLVGNVSLDTDQNRACEELGIERKNKKVLATLGKPNYHFFAYGPGLSDKVIKIKFNDPQTTHVAGWKLNKKTKPIPTPENIKKLLSQFSGLEQEAEIEIKTKDDMKQRIVKLEQELRVEKSKVTPGSPGDAKRIQQLGENLAIIRNEKKQLHQHVGAYQTQIANLETYSDKLENTINQAAKIITTTLPNRPEKMIALTIEPLDAPPAIPVSDNGREFIHDSTQVTSPSVTFEIEDLGQGPKKMLQTIKLFYPRTVSFSQVGCVADYTPGGGTFGNYSRELKRKGFVDITNKRFTLTQKGIDATKDLPVLPVDNESLYEFWSKHLGIGPMKLLRNILDNPYGLTLETLADNTEFTFGAGTFGNYQREIKRMEIVIMKDNLIIPNPEFWST